jgi:hypothetical protein|tara:strand:- start:72 stop:257 length:186 start_codon:yes stop_codon:yes gene_type:complete
MFPKNFKVKWMFPEDTQRIEEGILFIRLGRLARLFLKESGTSIAIKDRIDVILNQYPRDML